MTYEHEEDDRNSACSAGRQGVRVGETSTRRSTSVAATENGTISWRCRRWRWPAMASRELWRHRGYMWITNDAKPWDCALAIDEEFEG